MNIKGYTRTQAQNIIYSGGIKIYTTMDPHIQSILDEEYANPENYPEIVQYALDYALTVTDPDGNEVNYSKEMMNLYFKNEDPSFDLLFDSPEEGQTYVDRYKADILANGSKVEMCIRDRSYPDRQRGARPHDERDTAGDTHLAHRRAIFRDAAHAAARGVRCV